MTRKHGCANNGDPLQQAQHETYRYRFQYVLLMPLLHLGMRLLSALPGQIYIALYLLSLSVLAATTVTVCQAVPAEPVLTASSHFCS